MVAVVVVAVIVVVVVVLLVLWVHFHICVWRFFEIGPCNLFVLVSFMHMLTPAGREDLGFGFTCDDLDVF